MPDRGSKRRGGLVAVWHRARAMVSACDVSFKAKPREEKAAGRHGGPSLLTSCWLQIQLFVHFQSNKL